MLTAKQIELTRIQGDYLMTIDRFIADNGYSPTIREIGRETNRGVAAVSKAICSLCDAGAITRVEGRSRTIKITEKGHEWLEKTPCQNG